MTVGYQYNKQRAHIELSGELGHHEAIDAMNRIAEIVDVHLPKSVELDLSGITFMDSSGIAVVVQLSRACTGIGAKLSVVGTPRQAYKVFSTAGITKLVRFEKERNT